MKKVFEIEFDYDQAIKTAAELQRKISDLTEQNKQLNKSTEQGSKEFVSNKAVIKDLRKEYNLIEKQIIENNAQKKLEAEYIEKADKELKLNLKTKQDYRNQNARLLKITQSLNLENEEQAEIYRQLTDRINENTEFLKENGTAQEKLKYNIGNYKNDISDALGELNPFNTGLEKNEDTFKKLKTGIIGATKSLLTFIATPIGMIVSLGIGMAMVVKEVLNYNNSILDSIKLTQDITNTFGEMSDVVRVKTQVIADTFNKGFEETLISARALVNEFGISYIEALDLISDGLLVGGQSNDEYLESLKEFSVFFADAGFSAQEFNRIITEGADVGIFKDKLPDAIKEFKLSIEEATSSSRDALINAFGQEFTDNLFANIQNGSITVKDALYQVSQETEKVGLNAQQAQQLTADLFRGAGEDAGGALKIFEAVNNALSQEGRHYSELEKQIKALKDANEALALAKDKALKSDSIISLKFQFKQLWTFIKTAFYQSLNGVSDRINNWNDRVASFVVASISAFNQLKESFNTRLADLKDGLRSFAKAGIDAFQIISSASSLDFSGAREKYNQFKQDLSDGANSLRDSFVGNNEQIKASFAEVYNATLEKMKTTREAMVELQKQYDEEDKAIEEEKDIVESEKREERKNIFRETEQALTAVKTQEAMKQLQAVQTSVIGQTSAEQQYADEVRRLEVLKTASKEMATAQALGSVASALGKESKIGKAFALAQAGMNIQIGITKAVASKGLAGFLEGLVIAIKGASVIGKIASTKTSFSRGGFLQGKSHAEGGIPFTVNGRTGFEAEGGEAIINKRSTALFRPLLSQINQIGGGVAFANGGIPTEASIDNTIDITSQLTNIKVINVARETAEMYDSEIEVENMADL